MSLNPLVWFGDRKLTNSIPKHFIKANTPVTNESLLWITSKLTGRYAIAPAVIDHSDLFIDTLHQTVYFEDSKEVMLYELRWAGNK